MADAPRSPILRHIRHLIGAGPAGLTDGELLDRFVSRRDEDAVAELVRRHGPLVLGACRRVLADGHAAEDVFQATFLVLVRKAAALDRRRPLGTWLYTVAYRLALTARAEAERRRRREVEAARRHPEAILPDRPDELCLAVEEELQRLPERYRAPLVLCYLEGKTSEQAAQALGWPRGSVSRRLAEARDRLRERLRCRGYLRPGVATAVLAAAAQAAPAVPPSLLDHTTRAALWFTAERGTTAGFLSAGALRLARKGLRTMALQKLKIASVLLLTVGLLGGGGTLAVRSVVGAPAAGPAPTAGDPAPGRDALPAGAAARLGSMQLRHGDAIHFLRFTPDGRRLVTAGKDGTLRLWDMATGTEIRRYERPEPPKGPAEAATPLAEKRDGPVPPNAMMMPALPPPRDFRVALSEDGRLLAAVRDNAAYVWDLASGRLLHTFRDERVGGPGRLADLAFTADGKSLTTVSDDRAVTVWDLDSGKQVRRRDGESPDPGVKFRGSVALAPGGRHVAWETFDPASQNAALTVQDLTTGKALGEAALPLGGARALTFAPDGKTAAWTSFDDVIRLWDATAAKEPRLLNGPAPANKPRSASVDSLVFTADGKTVAACRSDGTVRIWDVASGKAVCQLGTSPPEPAMQRRVFIRMAGGLLHASPVQLAFAPDGKTVAASLGGSVIRRFDAHTGQEIAPTAGGHAGPVTALHLAPDGQTLTTYAANDDVHVWDLATGREARRVPLPRNVTHTALAADGRYLAASAGDAVTVWDLATAEEAGKINPGPQGVTALALAPDGQTVATRGQLSREITLWDRATGRARQTLTASAEDGGAGATQVLVSRDVNGVLCPDLVFSPDGRYLAGAGPKRQLCLWDVPSGRTVWEQTLPGDQVAERLAFTGRGLSLAALNHDGTVTLYERATGEPRCRLGRPSPPRGAPIAMVGGMPFRVDGLGGEGSTPLAVAGSADGRFLATAYAESVIHLWDVVTGTEVGQLKGHDGGVVSLVFSADGERLVSGSVDTTALVWDVGKRCRAVAAEGPAPSAADLEAEWAALAGEDAARAFAAVRQLAGHPAQAAEVVRQHLRPAAAADPERLARLIADLDRPEFAARQKATADLAALGEQARPALTKALAGDPSLEVRQRMERLLDKLSGKPGGNQLREVRAVEALELAGGPEARQALEALARGAAEARLTREARAALQRLTR
jgi:RNA polymerase sigma factor (sigma-70 family)